ncbi:MAG TPA: hypothetical protein VLM91_12435 [Candidatus Methylomirabilis sp.]|nr:hypothetical protein [Candidatus Methylomirabilis sp.]
MRKFLMVVAVGALALLVAAPAMAVDFKFGAEYRVRFYDYGNLGFNDGPGTNPRGVQVRIRPRFDASDDNGNITATWRAEFGDTQWGGGGGANGQPLGIDRFGATTNSYSSTSSSSRVGNGAGGGAGADGVALETKWGYMDFALPFGVPLRLRAGIQPWYLTKGLFVDDDFSGLRAYGSIKPVSYELWWFRANRGGTTSTTQIVNFNQTKDNALDFYGVKFDFAVAKAFNPYIWYVYGDNKSNCDGFTPAGTASTTAGQFVGSNSLACVNPAGTQDRSRPQHYVSAGFVGDVGFMTYDLDWVGGQAKGGPTGTLTSLDDGKPIRVQGWVLDGGVHIPIGPVRLNIVGSYATGDKQNTSGHKSNAYPGGPGPSWSGPSQVAGGAYELIGEGGRFDVFTIQQAPTNLWTLGFSVEYNPVKALNLRAHYLYAGFSHSSGNCAKLVTDSIGCFGPAYQGGEFVPTGTTNIGTSNAGIVTTPAGNTGIAAKSTLGQEIGLLAEYNVWTGFKIQGFSGWLIPSSGSTTGKYVLQFLYNF